jgi:hypothetical protein
LANCNGLVATTNASQPHPPITSSVLCMAPAAREVEVVKPLDFPVRDQAHRHFMFPMPNFHMELLAFLRSSPPCFSRALPASRLLLRA